MKKAIMAKIISLCAVVVLLTVFLIVSIVQPGFFGMFNFGFGGTYTYDDKGYSVGNAELEDEIKNIDVDWLYGNVEISVTDEKTLSICENEISEDQYKLRYKVTDNSLNVKFIENGRVTPMIKKNIVKDLVIKIPKDLADKMENIGISSTSADITVNDIKLKSLNVNTASGNVIANNIYVNTIFADTASGDVNLTKTAAQKIECNTASGDMNFNGKVNEISFNASSGMLTAEFSDTPKSIYANTASGNINLTMPKDIKGFYASLDSASGRIQCDFDGRISGENGFSYGESGVCTIIADTASGSLNIGKGE